MVTLIEKFRPLSKEYSLLEETSLGNGIVSFTVPRGHDYIEVDVEDITYVFMNASASNNLGLLFQYLAKKSEEHEDKIWYGVCAFSPEDLLKIENGNIKKTLEYKVETNSRKIENGKARVNIATEFYNKVRDESIKTNTPFYKILESMKL